MRAHGKAGVIPHRLQSSRRQRPSRASSRFRSCPSRFCSTTKFRLVRFEKRRDLVTERKPSHSHVVEDDAVLGEEVESLHAGCVAAADGHEAQLDARGRLDDRRRNGPRRALDLAVDAIDDVDVLVTVFGIDTEPIVAGAAREVGPIRMDPRQRPIRRCRRRRRPCIGGTSSPSPALRPTAPSRDPAHTHRPRSAWESSSRSSRCRGRSARTPASGTARPGRTRLPRTRTPRGIAG